MNNSVYKIILMIFTIISCDSSTTESDGDGGNLVVELPYDVGETLMAEHLDMSFSICYGSDNDSLKFSDFSGKVILLNLAASW